MNMSRFYCDAPSRAVIAIGGDDRVSFLQALISNDVTELPPDHARWAALLTPQGKYLCDFFVVAGVDRLLIDVEAAGAADLLTRLKRYRLRAKVTFDLLAEAGVLLGWGEDAAADFGLAMPGQGAAIGETMVIVDPRLDRLGIRVIGDRAEARRLLERTGFVAGEFPAWDMVRLEAGVPDGTRDLVPEQSILLEAGFDELHGVSWTKGCYIGQELTARTKYRALIKKRLLPVRITGPVPEFGAAVTQDGKDVGEMRSAQGEWGLALLRLETLQQGPYHCGDATLIPVVPGWLNIPVPSI